MPDINKITVSGLVTNIWSYRDNLYAMLAIYDEAAPGEDVAQLLAQLRAAGVEADRLEQVAAILDAPGEERPRQDAHYATVRFEHGLGPDGQPVTLTTGMRVYVSGKYHEDRSVQNLWRAIRQTGLDTTQFSPGLRQQLEGAGFLRPAPYIIPEGFSILQRNGGGKRSPRRPAAAPSSEEAVALPAENSPAEVSASPVPTRRRRSIASPAAKAPEKAPEAEAEMAAEA